MGSLSLEIACRFVDATAWETIDSRVAASAKRKRSSSSFEIDLSI
jgi:hypothetical protein